MKTYVDTTTKSGTPLHRSFCPHCGSPVRLTTAFAPLSTFVAVPAGTLDGGKESEMRRAGWQPDAEYFIEDRAGCLGALEGVAQVEGREK